MRKNKLNGKFTSIQMEKVHSHGGWEEIECAGGQNEQGIKREFDEKAR